MAENDNLLPSVTEFSQDISAAEAPKPLPARSYTASIVKAEARISSKGNKMGVLTFLITPDQFPADIVPSDFPSEGVTLSYYRMSLEDNSRARWQIKKLSEVLRVPVSRTVDMNDFMGKRALLTVKNEEYEGEMRSQIDKIEQA